MVEGDEKELLARAKGGDIAAFGVLFERERTIIEGTVRKIFHNKHDADDVVQEIFLRSFAGIIDFRGDSKLSTWLCRNAINLCVDLLRKDQAHPHETLGGSFPEEQVRSPSENPEGGRTRRGGKIERNSAFRSEQNEKDRELQREEHRQILHTVLEQLDPQEGNAIKLVHFQGKHMAAEEAAAIVGFNKRSKIYEITRKYVNLCLKARDKLLRSKEAVQPVERSP